MKLFLLVIISYFYLGNCYAADTFFVDYGPSKRCLPENLPPSLDGTFESVKQTVTNLFDLNQVVSMEWFIKEKSKLYLEVYCADYVDETIIEPTGVSDPIISDTWALSDAWVKPSILEEKVTAVKAALTSKGYSNIVVETQYVQKDKENILAVKVNATNPPKIDRIVFTEKLLPSKISFKDVIKRYIGRSYDKTTILALVDELKILFKDNGIYYVQIKEAAPKQNASLVQVTFDITYGKKIGVNISQKTILTHQIKEHLRDTLFSTTAGPTTQQVSDSVSSFLQKRGIFNSQIKLTHFDGVDNRGIDYRYFYLTISKGSKVKIEKLKFVGLTEQQAEKMNKLYFVGGDDIVKAGFLNKQYSISFSETLKKQLLTWGILYVKVNPPSFTFDSHGRLVTVRYLIQRGSPFTLASFSTNISSIDRELDSYQLTNKIGQRFNPLKLKEDLQVILTEVLNKGYFFAKYRSLSPEAIVKYDLANNEVHINARLDGMVKAKVKDYIITGNLKTKPWVVDKILNLSSGDILTPLLISDLKSKMLRSGIFGTVDVQTLYIETINGEDFYRLMIKAEERKGGRVIFALGYRTDLGVKFDTKVDYGNFNGEGKSFGVDARLNQRLNNELDQIRTTDESNLIEYNLGLTYRDPFLFKSGIEFSSKLGLIRERYYSFDADIRRLSSNFRLDLWKNFTFSLRYQVENVRQYNADTVINEASFRVGSLTPQLVFDFRNRPVRTSSGGKIDLSWEFANPFFGAMEEDDLTINYNKIVLKSVYYVPTSFGTIALMAAMGAQKNFATENLVVDGSQVYWSDGTARLKGYIPSIKVFRLEGMYNIRGYSFDESNTLIEGVDISTKPVQDMAYFSVFKIEPRYFYSDSIVMSLFFDAGRVFFNTFQPLNLRTSAGVSFKYVTPVGTIDLDYGVKLNRIETEEIKEKFGRVHFSIGFF